MAEPTAVAGLEFLGAATASGSSELSPLLGPGIQPAHVAAISRTQEAAGFDGILTTETSSSAHALVLGTQVLSATERVRVVIAARPGPATPMSTTRALGTLDAFHPDRLGLYLPPVDNDEEFRREGDSSTRGQRQERRAEFLDVLRTLQESRSPLHHHGNHYQLDGAWSAVRPAHPVPVYLSGLSSAADALAARCADVYLLPAEASTDVAARIARVRAATERTVRFGLRVRPIVGPTRPAATRYADRLVRVRRASDSAVSALRAATGALDDAHELIGTPHDVATTLLRYVELGITTFQFSGYEPLEDVHRFGEVIALLRDRAALDAALPA